MSLLANSNAIESGGYNIDRSLRFRSSASAYLNRTSVASPADFSKWTYSGWVKRGLLGGSQNLIGGFVDGNNRGQVYFSSDALYVSRVVTGTFVDLRVTNAVFRDPSAWYHVVVIFDANNGTVANRIRIFVNGIEQTYSTSNDPGTGSGLYVNRASTAQYIGQYGGGATYFDGYLAEVNFIDGQALTPSSFGETDTTTGAWIPKKYGGTYGTNGFYLNFSDNTSATTLAYDKSGNGNNWTANNISTTSGSTYDSMLDVPTLTSATASNFCVLNSLDKNPTAVTLSNGNLTLSTSASNYGTRSTYFVSSGKWYWEINIGAVGSATTLGIADATWGETYVGSSASSYGWYFDGGSSSSKVNNAGFTSYGASPVANDVVGVALDMDAGTITFYKNNTSQGVAFTGLSGAFSPAFAGQTSTVLNVNFGQRPFSYTPPTGFKALNTFNLPDPTIKKPNQYMDATLWTGNDSTQTITNSAGFQPDLIWVKSRSSTPAHALYDSVRGVSATAAPFLQSNTTLAELDYNGTVSNRTLTSINANGFSLGADQYGWSVNKASQTYVGWQWKESATAGFDIVTYTGTGSALNVNHSLGVAPKFIIVKDRSASNPWPTYHASLGSQYYTLLNATDASYSNLANYWGASGPSSTTFTVGPYGGNNTNGNNYVAYLFAEIPSFSKFGSYTGNGSSDGPFVYCGFRPKYVMVKRTDAGGENWNILDASRNTYNVANNRLSANSSSAEDTGVLIDLLSSGFKIRESGVGTNANGGTYIFACFSENPFKYSNAR